MRLFACRAGRYFGDRVSRELIEMKCIRDGGLEPYLFKQFECGENKQHGIERSVRGADVYIFQSGTRDSDLRTSVDDNFMELCRFVDGMHHASAGSITAVMPLMPYSRQDKLWERGEPSTAKLMAKMLEAAGATRFMTLELHSDQIRSYFDIPVEALYASYIFLDRFKGFYGTDFGDFVFTSTDAGGGERAKHYHKKVVGSGLAFGNKVKSYGEDKNEVESVDIVGDVDGKNVIIIEDMIDTGGSILKAAEAAKNNGANNTIVVAAHGIFSGDAEKKLTDAYNSRLIDKVWCSDSVFHCEDFLHRNKWLEEISVTGLFARVIQKLHHGEGVSEIYRD